MGDSIKKTQYDQMKNWVQSIYNTTKGSTPSISDVTQGGIVLASQAQTLQDLLTTAYGSYVSDACSSNYTSVYTTDNDSEHGTYTTVACSSNNSSVNSTNKIGYVCSHNASLNGHDGGDK